MKTVILTRKLSNGRTQMVCGRITDEKYDEIKVSLPVNVTTTYSRIVEYWSPDTHGQGGLAANGPTPSCRIGPAMEEFTMLAETMALVSMKAVAKWEEEPWK